MAYLDKRRKIYKDHIKYYYYSRVANSHWTKGYTNVALETNDVKEARKRHQEVEDNEGAVKDGQEVEWTWKNPQNRGRAKIKTICVGDLIDEFLKMKKVNVRASTYRRYTITLKAFTNVIGRTCPPKAINNRTIEQFKRFYQDKHQKGGININLRGIKCFLKWGLEEEHIIKMPKIVLFKIQSDIKYINEDVWEKIMALKEEFLSQNWKDKFTLYRDIGLRLQEVIMGNIEGSFLIVPKEWSKTGIELEVPLTEHQIGIARLIHLERDEWFNKKRKLDNLKGRYTNKFSEVYKKLGLYKRRVTTFHTLRHTFAIRTYIQTKSIFIVSRRLFHTDMRTTTKHYAHFNIDRLAQEFPKLSEWVEKQAESNGLQTINPQTARTIHYNPPLIN